MAEEIFSIKGLMRTETLIVTVRTPLIIIMEYCRRLGPFTDIRGILSGINDITTNCEINACSTHSLSIHKYVAYV